MIYIGAEIFIERGQTPEEIDGWFKIMRDYGLGLTRIRMFESYMRTPEGGWDFSLFDTAFMAAEKHGIKIYANLFPDTDFSDVGGFKFPKSDENYHSISTYVEAVVTHFVQFESLYGWVPINEPGAGELPTDSFTAQKFKEWKDIPVVNAYKSNGFTVLPFSEHRFLLHYNSWFLEWLTFEIRKFDPINPIHVNNHDIFKNVGEYDFPAWRKFLTSLGGSAHASWHFEYFNRLQYGIAMSANAEILRSGAGDLPWFMTELQGGNNTYSAKQPMCPTKEEIAQWLWINIGSGSKGAMFWCLNPRRSGFEAGEWAMLDFLNQATDRLLMAASVSSVISKHHELLDGLKIYNSGISVLYSRESLWIESALQIEGTDLVGRSVGGVMKSALAYFEAFSEMGIHTAFKEFSEYDFERENFIGEMLIISHQISIPSKYWPLLTHFVYNGGKLVVDGLTAYYDENAYMIQGADFPLKECFGGVVKEYKIVDELFNLEFDDPDLVLNAHLWQGLLQLDNALPVAMAEGSILASRNSYGRGSVFWAPALLGLGSRLTNYKGLSKLLFHECERLMEHIPIRFDGHYPGLLLKLLTDGDQFITIIVNKCGRDTVIKMLSHDFEVSEVIFSTNTIETPLNNRIKTINEDTLVLRWKRL